MDLQKLNNWTHYTYNLVVFFYCNRYISLLFILIQLNQGILF